MRRLSLTSLVVPLILGGAVAGCGGPEATAEPELHTVAAGNLRLVGSPPPESRQLTVQYVAGALLWESQPVARVEVDQDNTRVVVRVFVNERAYAYRRIYPQYALLN